MGTDSFETSQLVETAISRSDGFESVCTASKWAGRLQNHSDSFKMCQRF
jgi:hypothetical protein